MKTKIVNGLLVLTAASLAITGCATKKNVREAIAPVQNQVNDVQKKTQENTTAIGDLDRNVARVDERTLEADRKAAAAAAAAAAANQAAVDARQRAEAAGGAAQQANAKTAQLQQELDAFANNVNTSRLIGTEKVYFKVGRSELDDASKATLDRIVQMAGQQKRYAIEVQGFTDKTGGAASNIELSRRRADAVVRYFVGHDLPLRNVHDLGSGIDTKGDQKTRDGRKQSRRVEVRVFSIGEAAATAQATPGR